jgi:hypothetical protein
MLLMGPGMPAGSQARRDQRQGFQQQSFQDGVVLVDADHESNALLGLRSRWQEHEQQKSDGDPHQQMHPSVNPKGL